MTALSIASHLGPGHRHEPLPDVLEADACVIGSGASGSVVAEALVDAGWSVAMVEEGPLLARTVTQEEADRDAPAAEVLDAAGQWVERGWPWTTRNVGGGTLFYGGASFRYQPVDFDVSAYLPGNELDVRWPFGLDALAPWYDEVERRLAVRPLAVYGGHDTSAEVSAADAIAGAAARLGYRPLSTPVAIDAVRCTMQPLCIDHQCGTGAKRDAVAAYLHGLCAGPRFALYSGVRGLALEQDAARAVAALRCLTLGSGRTSTIRARHYFLACNAIQTAALLLRSRTRYASNGLGNARDLVGRGLCMKLSAYSTGMRTRPPGAGGHRHVGGPFSRVALLDHYTDPACPSGLGGLIYESRSLPSPPDPDTVPLEVETIIADRPVRANRVALSPNTDAWGVPKVRLHYRPDPTDLARLHWMSDRCEGLLREAGTDHIRTRRALSERGSTHLHGTCRSGTDPADSVTDAYGTLHEVDNVHVVDGAFMPFPGGLNPTLTIQANALRIARHIAAR